MGKTWSILKWWTSLRPRLFYLILLILGIAISFLVVLIAVSKYGPGTTFDSANYIAVSRNILAGYGVINLFGEPFILQPPLYSVTVALLSWLLGVDPIKVVGVYNASLFAIIACTSIWLLRGFAKLALWEEVIFFVVLISSTAILGISVMVFSDALFIEICLLFLIFLNKYLQRQKASYFLLFATFASLACLTRYIGVALIVAGAFVLVNSEKGFRRFVKTLFFGFIASLPLAFWLYRNYRLSSSLVGIRGSSIYSLSDCLYYTLKIIGFWFFPGSNAKLFVGLSVLVLLTVWCIFLVESPIDGLMRTVKKYRLLVVFIFIYLLFLEYTASHQALESIDDRYLAPIFVPSLIFLLLSFRSVFSSLWSKNRRTNKLVLVTLLIVFFFSMSVNVLHRVREISRMVHDGVGGLNIRHWHESELIKSFKRSEFNDHYVVYSNAPDLIYFVANRNCMLLPRKIFYNSLDSTGLTLETLKKSWPQKDSCYIVWIYNHHNSTFFDLSELSKLVDYGKTRTFDDGEIIEISRKPKDILSRQSREPSFD